ncbi:testis-expressed protein 26 [Aulostomus maculatus]
MGQEAPSVRALSVRISVFILIVCIGCRTLAAANSLEYFIGHSATGEGKHWWDPYETSQRREFIYRPNSAPEILFPTSTSFIPSYSQSGPFGSTVYDVDFCWKPASKPECICAGTASGQRRNNPHPSQYFMMWKLPRNRNVQYAGLPWKYAPSELEIRKAVTAQYCSVYKCDFMGMRGFNHTNKPEQTVAPQHRKHQALLTEMRDNYRPPKLRHELLGAHSNHSCNSKVGCCGIVPTVVQRRTRQKGSALTTYDRFCGKSITHTPSMISHLLPQDTEQSHRILPEEG